MYFIIVLVAMAVIFLVNLLVNPYLFNLETWYILVAVIVNTVAVIAVSGLVATIVRKCIPERIMSIDNMEMKVNKKEVLFYEKIGVKKWKEKILELGATAGFRKNKISDPKNIEFTKRYILEIHYGVYVHIFGMIASFLIIFIYPLKYFYMFGLPVALVSVFLHFLPLCALRYNLPKLKKLHQLNIKRESREN